ncbi:MAG: SprB repeat-containing protein, partial [Bacteroidota bacterium]
MKRTVYPILLFKASGKIPKGIYTKSRSLMSLLLCFIFCSLSQGPIQAQCLSEIQFNTQDASCDPGDDGIVTIAAADGQAPFTYEWSGPVAGSQSDAGDTYWLTGLLPGLYQVTVTDNGGCSVQDAFTIVASGLDFTAITSDALCFGNNDGSVNFVFGNGQAPFTGFWSDGTLALDRFDLAEGIYLVTITDGNDCTGSAAVTINEPSELAISSSAIGVSCSGGSDGSIDAVATGGTRPYTYLWSNPGNTTDEDLIGLRAGFYELTVTDANGCISTLGTIVDEPPAIVISVIDVQAACLSSCNGLVEVEVSGGVGNYTYAISTPFFPSTTNVFSDLCAGAYEIVVTDDNGCTASVSVTVNETFSPDLQINADITTVACNLECTGSVDLRISCGTPPYSIDWEEDNFDGLEEVENMCAGSYPLTITDAMGLTVTEVINIDEPDPLDIVLLFTTDSQCFGECSGIAQVIATGGTAPYAYQWPQGESTPISTNVCPGNYAVSVFDANGCSAILEVSVFGPPPIDISVVSLSPSCNQDGRIEVQAFGGIAPYNYMWSNGEEGAVIENLEAGTYSVTATDAFGCTSDFISPIEVLPAFDLEVSSTLTNCGQNDGTAMVEVNGVSDPSYEWSNGATGASISNLAPGGYSVTVVDNANGCRRHANVIVELNPACFAKISGFVVEDPVGACTGINGLTPVPFIQVVLDNGMATFTDADGYYEFAVEPGNYIVDVVLANSPFTGVCVDPIAVNAANFGGAYPNNHFYLENAGISDLGLKVSKLTPRPGFTRTVRICVMNYGSEPMDGVLTFVHDPMQEYVSTNFTPDSYDENNQTLTWSFSNHPPGFVRIYRVQMK